MPELPEVETVRRVLDVQLRGRTILGVSALRPDIVAHPDAETFAGALTGRRISGMDRRGKFLRIMLDDGGELALHLRMTGALLVMPCDMPPEPHTHMALSLSGGEELRFSDMRRLGKVWLRASDERDDFTGMAKLGLEPFDAALDAAYLRARLGCSRRAIKTCLMDQAAIAGIGNIYSDEILFAARIDPARQAVSLSAGEWELLAQLIPERMRFFVDMSAISAEDYLAGRGKDYRNTPHLQVYGHAGEVCPRCCGTLARRVIGGRGSVSCPACQK